MDELEALAHLIKQRNTIARKIADLTGRPAQIGHLGEFIASKIFNITLMQSASEKSIDGHFNDGILQKRSVNIKWYSKHDGLLAITPNVLPDFYLVMTGPKTGATSSRGMTRPWAIEFVFLFDARELVTQLKKREVKINEAISVAQQFWGDAEIYPTPKNTKLHLSNEQIKLLQLFGQP